MNLGDLRIVLAEMKDAPDEMLVYIQGPVCSGGMVQKGRLKYMHVDECKTYLGTGLELQTCNEKFVILRYEPLEG